MEGLNGLGGMFRKLRSQFAPVAGETDRRRSRDASFHSAGQVYRRATDRDEDRMTTFAHRVAALGADQARGFIDRFYAADEAGARQAALLMTLRAGGAEAGRFLGELLDGGPIQETERRLALRTLPALESPDRIAVAPELAERAFGLSTSADADERMGGAGLLGTQETPRARERLMQMAEADADVRVRAAAVRMLGKNGDRTTLNYLRAYPAAELAGDPWAETVLDGALWELEKKFA